MTGLVESFCLEGPIGNWQGFANAQSPQIEHGVGILQGVKAVQTPSGFRPQAIVCSYDEVHIKMLQTGERCANLFFFFM